MGPQERQRRPCSRLPRRTLPQARDTENLTTFHARRPARAIWLGGHGKKVRLAVDELVTHGREPTSVHAVARGPLAWRRPLTGEEAELAEKVHLVEEQVLGLERLALGDVERRPPELNGSSCRR